MRRGALIALGVVGFFVLLLVGTLMSFVGARNTMVAKDEAVKAQWSEVDVQLQRRADLIPNLVETVKGFTKEESTVFGEIANARAGMLSAKGPSEKIAANGKLDSALGRLLMLSETTRNCARMTSSCACRMSFRARRTASRSPASATTTLCATTTSPSAASPTASGLRFRASSRTMPSLRPRPALARLPPSSSKPLQFSPKTAKGASLGKLLFVFHALRCG